MLLWISDNVSVPDEDPATTPIRRLHKLAMTRAIMYKPARFQGASASNHADGFNKLREKARLQFHSILSKAAVGLPSRRTINSMHTEHHFDTLVHTSVNLQWGRKRNQTNQKGEHTASPSGKQKVLTKVNAMSRRENLVSRDHTNMQCKVKDRASIYQPLFKHKQN